MMTFSVTVLALIFIFTINDVMTQQSEEKEELDKVKIFSFQRGLWTIPSDKVYLRYNFSRDAGTVNVVSICYRIRFESFSKAFDVHVSYKAHDNNGDPFYFGNSQNHFDSWFDNQEQPVDIPWRIFPEVWRHVCHIITQNTYSLYWEGQEVSRSPLRGQWPLPLNGTLVLGQEQDNLGGMFDASQIFLGDLTQVSIWDRILTSKEVVEMAQCRQLGRGNRFSSDTADFEVFQVPHSFVDLKSLCIMKQHFAVFPEERTMKDSRSVCHVMNSSLAVPADSLNNAYLHEHVLLFQDVCVPSSTWKIWLGITDVLESGVWRDFDTNEVISFVNFAPVSASTSYVCAVMMSNGLWDGDRCTNKRCTACYFQSSDYLVLRGLCFEDEFRARFRQENYLSGRPYFRGYYNFLITWKREEKRWVLVDTATNSTLLWARTVGKDKYPLGKHEWEVIEEICEASKGTVLTLSFSPCAGHHFMCDSGDCIERAFRCDLRYDCDDGSDEVKCDVVEMVDELQRQLPPSGGQGQTLSISPIISITRIASIDDINMVIDLEFQLMFTWTDTRLRLRHLNELKNGTILTDGDSQRVWRPRYHLTNLEGGHMKRLGESLLVRSAKNSTMPSHNSVDMDWVFPGAANEISLIQDYTAKTTCYFELYAYPFDQQVCSVDLKLATELEGYVRFVVKNGSVGYTGREKLSMYSIRDVKFGSKSGDHQLSVEFSLHRRQGVVVFSTFLPSAMLLLVSWATLFINLKDLNVRAVMSLTTLLVLYTLFANMSRSLPTTASIKLIDIWFFFIIFLLFINIMIHVFVSDKKPEKNPPTNRMFVNVSSSGGVSSFKGQDERTENSDPVSIRFLKFYRLIGIPTLVVIFMAFFSTAVLMYL